MGVHADPEIYTTVREFLGIPEDEPIFILRAQDKIAYDTIYFYSGLAANIGCDPTFLEGIRQIYNKFSHFSVENSERMKRPD